MPGWEHFGHGPRGPRRFERGDLRFVLLDLLEDHPSYGYELIRSLEERFHGFYSPSPGTVYPTLQWLQDLGYVSVSEQDGRKIYTITDEGRRFLAAERTRVDEIWDRMRRWWSPFDRAEFREEMHDFMRDLRDIAKDLRHEARWASPEKLRRVREVVTRAGREIEDILREPEPGSARASRPGSPGGQGPGENRPSTPPESDLHGDTAANI